MNYVFSLISLLVGIFFGVMIVTWFSVMPNYELSPSLIAYSAGTVIALCALGLTLFQAHQTRKHQALSVLPHLAIAPIINYPENAIELKLLNNGLGPARILDFKLMLDGTVSIIDGRSLNAVESAARKLFSNAYQSMSTENPREGELIPAQYSKTLFKVFFYPETSVMKRWHQSKGRMEIEITYESLYGQSNRLREFIDDSI